jgi:hypothetical protein
MTDDTPSRLGNVITIDGDPQALPAAGELGRGGLDAVVPLLAPIAALRAVSRTASGPQISGSLARFSFLPRGNGRD